MYLGKQSRRRLGAAGRSSARRPLWRQYTEQVTKRHGNGKYTIMLREDPITALAGLGLQGLRGATVNPGTIGPWSIIGPAVVSKSGGTASSALESSVSGASQGFALGGPIGAGIGAIAGAIAGIWASHAARAKGATTENAAMNSAVQAFDQSLQTIFSAANSGQITASQAAGLCSQVMQSYWSGMAPYQVGPGRADASNGGANCGTGLNPGGPCIGMPGGPPCNSKCTAGCCVGCQDLYPTILQAIAVFNSTTGGTVTACAVSGSGYGGSARASYSLTYTPPSAATAGGLETAVESDTVGGIPLWVLLAGGIGAFLAFR